MRKSTTGSLDLESQFGAAELFFSKTDFRGVIESGNSIFVRVSEYSEEELLKKPHSIVRHPDMPRAVFKLLWDFLKSEKPIIAYVKNQSKSGRFYWVLAMAFPMQDGYLSIRLKPSSPIFDKVKSLYEKMLEIEKETDHTMDSSTQHLIETLASLGYTSYEAFMIDALVAELNSRDAILSKEKPSEVAQAEIANSDLAELVASSKVCTEAVRSGFDITNHLYENLEQLKGHSQEISSTCQMVRFTTTNLTISSAKAGEAGKPLSVVSANLGKLTHDISVCANNLEETFKIFHEAVKEMNFTFAVSRFQIEMMNQLLRENIASVNSPSFIVNMDLLCYLVTRGFESVQKTALVLNRSTRSLLQACKDLKKTVAGMDVINVVGRIEMIRITDTASTLSSILEEMENLTGSFKKSLRSLEVDCNKGIASSLQIEEITQHISHKLGTLEGLKKIRNSESLA